MNANTQTDFASYQPSTPKKITSIAVAITLVAVTAALGSLFTNASVKSDWYTQNKPKETPPNWVFPIVWTILYILIAIALSRALLANNIPMIILFIINLMLNVLWCYAYFKRQDPKSALAIITLLLVTIVAILAIAYTTDITILALLVPYLLWISFATFLNARTVI